MQLTMITSTFSSHRRKGNRYLLNYMQSLCLCLWSTHEYLVYSSDRSSDMNRREEKGKKVKHSHQVPRVHPPSNQIHHQAVMAWQYSHPTPLPFACLTCPSSLIACLTTNPSICSCAAILFYPNKYIFHPATLTKSSHLS